MAQTFQKLFLGRTCQILKSTFLLSFSPKLSNLTAYRIYDGIPPTGEQGEKYL